ncbi:protein of unknown function [Pseudomonas sp. JV551A1]|uniref:Uncharacterized protein n=1 Tax=Pseudomonas inefficax TaxID=2078786 RepID=A0AAQ1P3T4_9PSED|nr:protein of unknown function [Pseudomonas sp. JV551A1]SPO58646.1 protein of unknown function [Pseudomonas inefficax]
MQLLTRVSPLIKGVTYSTKYELQIFISLKRI